MGGEDGRAAGVDSGGCVDGAGCGEDEPLSPMYCQEELRTKLFCELEGITACLKVGARHHELGASDLLGSADDGM